MSEPIDLVLGHGVVDGQRVEGQVLHVVFELADATVEYSPGPWSHVEASGNIGFVAESEDATTADLVEKKEYEQTYHEEHNISHKDGCSPRI